jgi:Reverse transcriptase (RNA-dependent DNA polymerase)
MEMESELDGLISKDTFSIIDSTDVPCGAQVIKSTWVFRLNRRPYGSIIKKKARFCVRGDIQELDDTEIVYAPVVNWGAVRLILIIAVAFGFHTKQVDFRNEFVQSSLPSFIFVELPQGFEQPGKVLLVWKSLYGYRRAPKLWFEYLRNIFCYPLVLYKAH